LGGAVRKGEKGTLVVYADKFIPKEERAQAREEGREARPIFFLKGFTVFNISQCDGLPENVGSVVKPEPAEVPERSAAIVKASRADLRIGGDKAYYTPQGDFIGMPHPAQFKERVEFDRTLFHELAHWSGHKTRLNRDLTNRFGSQGYAREELVAEVTSAMVAAAMGIEPTVRHADYLNSWLAVLKADKRASCRAGREPSEQGS